MLGKTIHGIDNYSKLCKAIQSCKTIKRFLMLSETILRIVIQILNCSELCESIQNFVKLL